MPERKIDQRRVSMWIAVGVVASTVLAGGASAQESCVPKDLVRGVLGVDVGKLFIGAPATESAATIPLPPGATTLGGITSDRGMNLVATLPRSTRQVRDEMKGMLESAGWKVRPLDSRQQGGFMARQREANTLYCAADGSVLHYSVQDQADGGSLLSIHRYSVESFGGACDDGGSGRDLRRSGPMPALEPPTGVSSSMQSSSHGFGPHGARSEAVVLSTTDTPRDLASHFSGQLADQGWTLDSDLVGDSMASQLWSLTDGAGKPWRGLLVIAVLDEESRDASFSITPRD